MTEQRMLQAVIDTKLRDLGEASPEAIRAVLAARERVEPEPERTPDTVARLRARLTATASDPSAEET